MSLWWSNPVDEEPAVPLTKILRIALLVAVLGTVIFCIVSAFIGFPFSFEDVIGPALLIIISLGTAMTCSIVRDQGKMPRRMLSGVAAALLLVVYGAIVLVLMRWFEYWGVLDFGWMIFACWAGLMTITGLLALPAPRKSWWLRLRTITVFSLYILAATLMFSISIHPDGSPLWTLLGFDNTYDVEEFLARLDGGLVLLVGGLVATTFLTMWLTPPLLEQGERLPFRLRCPRCQSEHHRQTGDESCAQCGLRIRVLVQ